MRRRLLPLLLLAAGLGAAPLDQLSLFDWSSPGEPAWELLRQAAAAVHAEGWAAERLAAGQALPQASARELALLLKDSAALDGARRRALAEAFADEPAGLHPEADTARLDGLERRVASLNARLDALEAAEKANHYDDRSNPSFSAKFTGAWIGGGAGGLFGGEQLGYPTGGLDMRFAGRNLGFDVSLHPGMGRRPWDPDQAPLLNWFSLGLGGLSASLGDAAGAWTLRLGGQESIQTSALVGGIAQGLRPDAGFFLDLEAGDQPTYSTGELGLDLPYAPLLAPNVFSARRSKASRWWPFSETLLFYNQPDQLLAAFNDKAVLYGGGLRLDLPQLLPFLRSNALRGAVTGYGNDDDRLRAFAALGTARYSQLGWAAAWEAEGRDGTRLQAEFGGLASRRLDPNYTFSDTSHLSGYTGGTIKGLERRYQDTAWVATLSRPFGPVSLGLEWSSIGAFFLPAAQAGASCTLRP